ncbi:hypothetical protein [Tumebacillus permanentifrigoris]|uniref:SPOR domain-containing protein n=1 Tax=Tumebacillus permanentifrigoris TaxID=378543 RepID=A0A316D5H9_9BACL|nr:hypothetical protein [Tumebacillus permanentifrigoris]PWK06259.1 hypothetical protein C7459_12022 [Tumebacillus permanentifrigoris]
MDQPNLNTQPNRQMSDREHITPNQDRSGIRFPSRHLRNFNPRQALALRSERAVGAKPAYLLPALLAIVTGVVLGVLLLVLFKDQSTEPTITTIPATPGQARSGPEVKGAAELAGQSMIVWQLGSFPDAAKAAQAQKDFTNKGIASVIRGTGPFQLYAAVASDKKTGAVFEAELNQRKVTFYAKEFKIPARQGYIANLKDAEAHAVVQGLQAEAKLGLDAMALLTSAKPDADKLSALKTALTQQSADQKSWHALLLKAGLQEEAAQCDTLHKQLEAAVGALSGTPNLLDGQAKLTAFFVAYETFTEQLISVQ